MSCSDRVLGGVVVDELCRIEEHTPLSGGYWELLLRAEQIATSAEPGQFVHLRVPGLEAVALRRPFSLYGAEGGCIRILYKRVGAGTAAMNRLVAGDEVSVIGPLGNGFPLRGDGCEPLLVAGGYGVAPLAFLAQRLESRGVLMAGGRSAEDILACSVFERLGWRVEVATEDGSRGTKGLVTLLLDREIERIKGMGGGAVLYSCGPDGLLRAVGERAIAGGYKGWLSLDKHMACGMGACLVCVQKLRRSDGSTWIGRVCHDGPVFESREIVWQS